ncbi:hypothetical protein CCACVL1_12429 [Corchorus capsularis]|uniref:Uncharacterized protein n=1 Tax=Corchorus capsularis TaxID=210143 RepID=A0A1R3IFL5_COCAP|nr:hypothetical protein CCACVL1_12429 [Corchorus capsularis]
MTEYLDHRLVIEIRVKNCATRGGTQRVRGIGRAFWGIDMLKDEKREERNHRHSRQPTKCTCYVKNTLSRPTDYSGPKPSRHATPDIITISRRHDPSPSRLHKSSPPPDPIIVLP